MDEREISGTDCSRDPRRAEVVAELARLYDLTATLRDLCPWDRAQTQQDIVAYTLEETYELVDAVRMDAEGRHEHVRDELGDLLFQVYFLARVAQQAGWYDLGHVAAGIHEKLVRRHPHIFGDAVADSPEEVRRTWDSVKRDVEGREGIFPMVAGALPATLFAQKLQQRAANVGFDWHDASDVLAKIREEADELEEAMADAAAARTPQPPPPPVGSAGDDSDEPDPTERPLVDPAIAHEVGDLLFSVINLARKVGADPELELRSASDRFRRRVEGAAELAAGEGVRFEELGLDAQEGYYQRAKSSRADGLR